MACKFLGSRLGSYYLLGIFIFLQEKSMRVSSSIQSLRKRHRACIVVRRRGRIYVVNKVNPRFKARQGFS